MLTLEEAQAKLLALAPAMPLTQDAGAGQLKRYLAQDLAALRTQPSADLSAMDGYAICGEGPWRKIGESRAGTPFTSALEPGQCTRISTGAHMPQGADRVLIQENASVEGETIALASGEAVPIAEQHVRKAGFDFAQGNPLLAAGTPLGAGQRALAIAGGHANLPVYETPRVHILDSGDELAAAGTKLGANQIPASNGPMLATMLSPWIASPTALGPVRDDRTALADALGQADGHILITSGGASVGDHDLVQQALIDWGAELAFWRVAIKPGKPLMVATKQRDWGQQVILGLPGNPVSSFVTAFLFALPLVRATLGAASPLPVAERRVAGEDLPATGPRREFLRGVSDGANVRLTGSQDSSALMALAEADCLIDRPAGSDPVRAGESVMVYNLQNG